MIGNRSLSKKFGIAIIKIDLLYFLDILDHKNVI